MSEVAEHLAHIKTVLHLNMSQVARLFDVSRQTIYDWQADRFEISPEHAENVRRLAKAADLFAEAGIFPWRFALVREIEPDRCFLDIARAGEPERAARILIELLQKEATARQRLQERLGARIQPIDWSECGVPHLKEE
jgi:transcriptional regulator with XRE-family HTH domain